ncbi:hypothetical protein [Enterovibrio calviensis]|uniref:hypothetical protein n=1 Tax=Enterovibrio calviensis TaxID=91359 RepID=UPI00048350C3|nr:hypothetical protein [Enterovibrio calviensis]
MLVMKNNKTAKAVEPSNLALKVLVRQSNGIGNEVSRIHVIHNVGIYDSFMKGIHEEVHNMYEQVKDVYVPICQNSSYSASESATEARTSQVDANTSMTKARSYKDAAKVSETNAKTSETRASASAATASNHEDNVTELHAVVVDKHGDVVVRHSAITNMHSTVGSKHSDVVTKHTDVVNKHREVEADRAEVATNKGIVAADKATVISNKNETNRAKDAAIVARNEAEGFRNGIEDLLEDAEVFASDAAISATQAQASEEAAEGYANRAETAVAAVTGAMLEMGQCDLSGGVYPAPAVDSNGQKRSCFWKVTKAGTVSGTQYGIGDSLVYSVQMDDYYKIDNTESVTSVAGKQGVVTLTTADIQGLDSALGAAGKVDSVNGQTGVVNLGWGDVGGNDWFVDDSGHTTVARKRWLKAGSDSVGIIPHTHNKSQLGTSAWTWEESWVKTYRGEGVDVVGWIQGGKGVFQSDTPSAQIHIKRTNQSSNVGIHFETNNKTRYLGMNDAGKLCYGSSVNQAENGEIYTTTNAPSAAAVGALPANGKATDSDKLDGLNSTDFSRSNHAHNYLPLSGGAVSNTLTVDSVAANTSTLVLRGNAQQLTLKNAANKSWHHEVLGSNYNIVESGVAIRAIFSPAAFDYKGQIKENGVRVYSSTTLPAENRRKITYGTAAPSGGSDGDIYVQIS